jgi:hypothetical protein
MQVLAESSGIVQDWVVNKKKEGVYEATKAGVRNRGKDRFGANCASVSSVNPMPWLLLAFWWFSLFGSQSFGEWMVVFSFLL